MTKKPKKEREPDLFDHSRMLYAKNSDTSRQAAESIEPEIRGKVRILVYQFFHQRGAHGATTDEAEVQLDLRHQTCSARVYELHKSGAIVDSGKRRLTRSGRSAAVFILPRFKEDEPCPSMMPSTRSASATIT